MKQRKKERKKSTTEDFLFRVFLGLLWENLGKEGRYQQMCVLIRPICYTLPEGFKIQQIRTCPCCAPGSLALLYVPWMCHAASHLRSFSCAVPSAWNAFPLYPTSWVTPPGPLVLSIDTLSQGEFSQPPFTMGGRPSWVLDNSGVEAKFGWVLPDNCPEWLLKPRLSPTVREGSCIPTWLPALRVTRFSNFCKYDGCKVIFHCFF